MSRLFAPGRLARLAALAGLLATTGCAALRQLPGGNVVADLAERDAARVGENAVKTVVSGEAFQDEPLSTEQAFHLGRTVAASVVVRQAGAVLPPEHEAARYVRSVGALVAFAAAELRGPDAGPWPQRGFRFIPVVSPVVNAVGGPGGFVVVTTGLLRAVRSEDELAAVLAHEVAHVVLGHPLQPVEAARKQERLTGKLLEGTTDVVHAFFGRAVAAGTDAVMDRGFGKQNELAADALAARILAEAGYDPAALPAFLGRLEGAAAKGGFFARHPAPHDRIRALGVLPAALRPLADTRRERLARAVGALPDAGRL